MKVYTKSVWQWVGDQLVRVDAECKSFEHTGPVDLLKGGSSGGPYYSGLEGLYNEQASSAKFLSGIFRDTVAPGYKDWGQQIKGYGSIANQEQQAQRAVSDVKAAQAGQQTAFEENIASLGKNAADPEYATAQRLAGIVGAGQEAGAATGAREQVRRQDIAQQQDWVGMGMGTPTTAAQASNAAGNALNSAASGQNIYNAQQAKGVGALAQLGTNIYGLYDNPGGSGTSYAKDGGLMLRLKQGGFVNRRAAQKFAGGGFARVTPITPPPPMMPKPPSTAAVVGGQSTTPLGLNMLRSGGGKALQMVGRATDSPQVTQFGYGLEQGPNKLAAQAAHQQAIQSTPEFQAAAQVDKALGASGATPASLPGAAPGVGDFGGSVMGDVMTGAAPDAALGAVDAATVAGSAEGLAGAGLGAAAAGEGAAAAGGGAAAAGGAGALGAGAALGAAMPWVGAGLAVYGLGSNLGWWKDGGAVGQQGLSRGGGGDDGAVTPGSVADTGEVDGPGGPKDDMINAQLSDGEYVFPKGAVMFFGLDKLDKMRQKGLEYEKQMGIA